LLLEIWAVFFLFFAAAGAVAAWREYQAWQQGAPAGKFLLAAAFCGIFLYLGATSLLRARR
jgi:hypothetical protein